MLFSLVRSISFKKFYSNGQKSASIIDIYPLFLLIEISWEYKYINGVGMSEQILKKRYCSWCYNKTDHKLMKFSDSETNKLTCLSCKGTTYIFRKNTRKQQEVAPMRSISLRKSENKATG